MAITRPTTLRELSVAAGFIRNTHIERVTGGLRESALARAIVQLGQAMGLATVAEGIETAEQAAVLRDLGCGYGQGYFFARPMTGEALRRRLGQPLDLAERSSG